MKDGGKAYLRALEAFHAFCVRRQFVLTDTMSVDRALFTYVQEHRRACGEVTLSALLRAYPPLRFALPWSAAAVRDLAQAQPTDHHPPMPWGVALLLAESMRLHGMLRRAGCLLLQWRLGLRPGEMLQLRREDLQFNPVGVGIVRLGMLRGTKTRRRAAVRVAEHDWRTRLLMSWFLRHTAPEARLCDWLRTPQITSALVQAANHWGLRPKWTAHTPRAGWATTLWLLGMPFSELRDAGRWQSDASLRCYLDIISATETLAEEELRVWSPWMIYFDRTFASRWG